MIHKSSQSTSRADDRSTERKIAVLGTALSARLRAAIYGFPGVPSRAAELCAFLGIDKTLCIRLVGAMKKSDPLAFCHALPGPGGLRTVLAAARAKGAPAKGVAAAEAAVDQFSELIHALGGSRTAFNTIIGGLLPDVRAGIERHNKKAAFDAMGNLLGYQVDTEFVACIIQPQAKGDLCESVCFTGKTGFKHLTPRVARMIWGKECMLPDSAAAPRSFTLDGQPIECERDIPILPEFCTHPIPPFQVFHHGNVAYVALAGDEAPSTERADIYIGSYTQNSFMRYRSSDMSDEYISFTPAEPARVAFIDVILRDDLWCGSEPKLAIFRTGSRGNLDTPQERPFDRIQVLESVTYLGQGMDHIHTNDIENYASMVRSLFDRVKWDARRFRAYRVRVEYPILHAQIMLSFPLPAAP